MRSFLLLVALAGPMLFVPSASGQETADSQLEFVRKLRIRGYLDLAKEYLDKLRANPDANLQAIIPLESARITMALARTREPDQRPGLFLSARADLETFVQKNPNRPETAQARLEIARLAAFYGETLLSKALRDDDPKGQQDKSKKAEAQFTQAGQELEVAAKALMELAANYKNPDPKVEEKARAQLVQEAYQARFDRAANLINRARCYLEDGKTETLRQRGELMNQAIAAFKEVAEGETPLAIKRQAEAWLIRCHQEVQDPQAARKYYNRVMNDETKAAETAQRLARPFFIQGVMMHLDPKSQYRDPDLEKDKFKPTSKLVQMVEFEARAWLKSYPNHTKTNEGWAVQYELANAILQQAQALKDQKALATTKLYDQAQKLYAAVADSDSDYAERASQSNLHLAVKKIKDLDLHQIKDFDDCFLKAKYEMSLLRQANQELSKEDDPKMQARLKEHARNLVAALARASNLADAKTPPAKLDEVRYYLMSAYFILGDPYRAAVAGDALARAKPQGKRAPVGAAYAIQAYSAIFNRDKEESNRQRLQAIVDFVLSPANQKVWATDPVTPVALYEIAILRFKEENAKEAVEILEKLPPDYTAYVFATSQAVLIAQDGRKKALDKNDISQAGFFEQKARAALARIPNLPADADVNTAGMYFRAQLEIPAFLYADAAKELKKNELLQAAQKYLDMIKFVDQIAARLAKLPAKLSKETQEDFDFRIDFWRKYARLGQSDIAYRAGRYDEVLKQTDEVIKQVEAKAGAGNDPIRLKDYQVTNDVLGLALRAKVQKGQIDDAKKILGWMDRLKGLDDNAFADTSNTLFALVAELKAQVEDLKKTKDMVNLKTTVTNFSAFVDALAAKPKLEIRDFVFLANCYGSLDLPKKAAELYARVPKPAALDKKDKLKPEEEKEVATYWYLRIEYAKALRLAKASKDDLKEPNRVLEELIRHPNGRLLLLAEKEKNHVLEDSELYGLAIKKWGEFMTNPGLKKDLANDSNLKKIYFEAYYQLAWCWFKYSQTETILKSDMEKKTMREKQFLTNAARYITRLESSSNQEGWLLVGDKFQRLLEAEPKLKAEYESLKSTSK